MLYPLAFGGEGYWVVAAFVAMAVKVDGECRPRLSNPPKGA